MKLSVVVEPVAGNGYRASWPANLTFCADAPTEEEAVEKLQGLIQGKLSAGVKIVQLDVAETANPWLRMAGRLDPNDPNVKEWIQIMEENRREADADPDYL